ncbi:MULTISPECIES: DUF6705 family protein [Flavobacterium]|uniref:DUF6705 domain-containing protein n=1 Tax=Flavobacterium hankyongi TaxID=1176532 RepID=A0ABP9A8F2_9FLAO|nr:DUF6705 family protein [Flavobacterium sp. N1846]
MKHVLKYLLIITAISCKSQIAPLNGLTFEYPNGTYFKDLNNELDYYVGRWEGTLNNKKYTFEFVKFTHHLSSYDGTTNGSYYYKDIVKVKLKVLDLQSNQILYDNLNAINYDDYLILGLAKKNGMFSFS